MAPLLPRADRSVMVASVDGVTLLLVWIVVALRCYTRVRIVKAFGLDDYFMVSFTIFIALGSAGLRFGVGQQSHTLDFGDMELALGFWWGCYLSYGTTMTFAKLSIAWFLARVAVCPAQKRVLYAVMAVVAATGVAFFFVAALQCRPVSFFWDKSIESGQCMNNDVAITLGFLFGNLSIVTDLILTLGPMWVFSRLNMNTRTKGIMMVFMATGLVATFAAGLRLAHLKSLNGTDFLYDTTGIAVWSTVEQALAIMAGSLATVQPLVSRLLGAASRNAALVDMSGPASSGSPARRRDPPPSNGEIFMGGEALGTDGMDSELELAEYHR
ncbi:hypothetical protein B0T26DRAFT_750680 [Lasiosphaeria miniovina]|uniref:Rhodopsin domain-containing protein n=1 Tax=Lasiosphaeria miniovina TaxID=1954250 RepID=A0AA40E5P2_9PEZI|nr:uncharacterized protein B0T26DRAFT_750680 [Lasiosphaeria miniovina]KAK0723408.1 hypothetical protein B0T26DRAFT_750680 [Lasiosphaeria miniovina]